jgi:hypothetical protein
MSKVRTEPTLQKVGDHSLRSELKLSLWRERTHLPRKSSLMGCILYRSASAVRISNNSLLKTTPNCYNKLSKKTTSTILRPGLRLI